MLWKITETLPVWVEFTTYVEADSEEEAEEAYKDGDFKSQSYEIGENVGWSEGEGPTINPSDSVAA